MLEIDFTNTKVHNFPSIQIYLDEDLLEEIQFVEYKTKVKIPLTETKGSHMLKIKNFGKTSNDTLVEENNIIQDTTMTIDKIIIDGFVLSDSILLECEFIPDWKDLTRPNNFPKVLKQARTIGPNGIWQLPLKLPVEDWFIERIHNSQNMMAQTYAIENSQMEYELSPHSTLYHKLNPEDIEQIARIKKLIND